MKEGIIPDNEWEKAFYELAIKVSGAVQASRWTPIAEGGFIHSFNGPHSLFVDTIRSLRILVMANELGHALKGENDVESCREHLAGPAAGGRPPRLRVRTALFLAGHPGAGTRGLCG